MKTAAIQHDSFWVRPIAPYPNTINRKQLLHKLLDKALVAVSGVGIGAILAFILLV